MTAKSSLPAKTPEVRRKWEVQELKAVILVSGEVQAYLRAKYRGRRYVADAIAATSDEACVAACADIDRQVARSDEK